MIYNNKNVYDFKKSLTVGNQGEEIIKNFLYSLNHVLDVKSVQDIKEYQEIDIDFLVTLKENKSYSIEVKTDTYTSGNLYYETISCIEKNTMGCFEKTKSDFIFYYFTNLDKLYILKTNLFRNWVRQEINHFNSNPEKSVLKQKEVFNKRYSKNKNDIYTSQGYTIPLYYLEKKLNNKKIYKIFYDISKNTLNKKGCE